MDKKSEEYLRQYIKLTDTIKQKIEAHAARYHIKGKDCNKNFYTKEVKDTFAEYWDEVTESTKQLWEINIPVAKENQEKMVFKWKELAKKYHCDFLGFDMIYNRVEIDIGWENGFPECDILNQIIKDIEKQRGES